MEPAQPVRYHPVPLQVAQHVLERLLRVVRYVCVAQRPARRIAGLVGGRPAACGPTYAAGLVAGKQGQAGKGPVGHWPYLTALAPRPRCPAAWTMLVFYWKVLLFDLKAPVFHWSVPVIDWRVPVFEGNMPVFD